MLQNGAHLEVSTPTKPDAIPRPRAVRDALTQSRDGIKRRSDHGAQELQRADQSFCGAAQRAANGISPRSTDRVYDRSTQHGGICHWGFAVDRHRIERGTHDDPDASGFFHHDGAPATADANHDFAPYSCRYHYRCTPHSVLRFTFAGRE